MNYKILVSYCVVIALCIALFIAYLNHRDNSANQYMLTPTSSNDNTNNKAPLTPEEVYKIVEDVISREPELIIKSVDSYYAMKAAVDKATLNEKVKQVYGKLVNNPADPRIGQGPIQIVEFFDYSCAFCRKMLPIKEKLLQANDNVQVIFKEMPILGEISILASKAALAVNMIDNSKYYPFHSALLKVDISKGEEAIMAIAADMNIEPNVLRSTMQKPEIEDMIQDNLNLAMELKIRWTPVYIINNDILPGAVEYSAIQAIIDNNKNTATTKLHASKAAQEAHINEALTSDNSKNELQYHHNTSEEAKTPPATIKRDQKQ